MIRYSRNKPGLADWVNSAAVQAIRAGGHSGGRQQAGSDRLGGHEPGHEIQPKLLGRHLSCGIDTDVFLRTTQSAAEAGGDW